MTRVSRFQNHKMVTKDLISFKVKYSYCWPFVVYLCSSEAKLCCAFVIFSFFIQATFKYEANLICQNSFFWFVEWDLVPKCCCFLDDTSMLKSDVLVCFLAQDVRFVSHMVHFTCWGLFQKRMIFLTPVCCETAIQQQDFPSYPYTCSPRMCFNLFCESNSRMKIVWCCFFCFFFTIPARTGHFVLHIWFLFV